MRFRLPCNPGAAALGLWLILALATGGADSAFARSHPESLPGIALGELPTESRDVYARIRAGGPFRYDRDGVVFGNRERVLPQQPRGHYREYTVPTPGARNRGARRIVCGGPPARPDACYYTDDHYRSFKRIRE
jgi:ribonuclease T1